MRRLIFAASLAMAPQVASSQVPGRDLLDFSIGNLAEGAGIATASGDGFRNPATALLDGGDRARFSVGAVSSPAVIGLSAQSLAASYLLFQDITATLSVVRAAVSGLYRTESDPQSIGDIPYHTVVVSGGGSRRISKGITGGVAVRYRTGTADLDHRAALGLDGGVIVRGLPVVDGRLGVSSFLWTPTGGALERATVNTAGDIRIAGPDSLRQARAGLSWSYTTNFTDERFLLLAGRLRELEARTAVGRVTAFGNSSWRTRLGIGVHHGRFSAAVAREESGADLAASYQFALTAVLR